MRVNASWEAVSAAAIVGARKARRRCLNRGEMTGTRGGSGIMGSNGLEKCFTMDSLKPNGSSWHRPRGLRVEG